MYILNEEHKIAATFLQKPWKKLTYSESKDFRQEIKELYLSNIEPYVEWWCASNWTSRKFINLWINPWLDTDSILSRKLTEAIAWETTHIPNNLVETLAKKIKKWLLSYFIVTGSYSKRTQTKKSDLDITIICDDSVKPQSIMAEIKLESI